MVVQAPERALHSAREARMYLARVLLHANGERRTRVTKIAAALDAAITQLEALVDSDRGYKK